MTDMGGSVEISFEDDIGWQGEIIKQILEQVGKDSEGEEILKNMEGSLTIDFSDADMSCALKFNNGDIQIERSTEGGYGTYLEGNLQTFTGNFYGEDESLLPLPNKKIKIGFKWDSLSNLLKQMQLLLDFYRLAIRMKLIEIEEGI